MSMPLTDLVEHLMALPTTEPVPRLEWEWLATHGTVESYDAGVALAAPGIRIDKLWIVLAGHVAVAIDRGAGARRVAEWRAGEVTGRLPYSRMGVTGPTRTNRAESPTEVLAIHERDFPEMVRRCPTFTAYCVHQMIDRARSFNANDLQDEKMVSLGRLAAGLAHELNNPASATVRAAKHLLASLAEAERASRALGAASASTDVLEMIERARMACLTTPDATVLSPLQQAEREDAIADWLNNHRIDTSLTATIADTTATIEALEGLARTIPDDVLETAVRWIAAGCSTHSLTAEIQDAAARIADLVAAVKRFTYMDNLTGPELVDVEPGLRDTIRVLASKAKSKGIGVTLEVEASIPRVLATGSELNQVWMNLIDNALDAAPELGAVSVNVRRELDRVAVRITDNGPGMPPDVLSHIFDPFFTTKPPGQGSGLGLDITRRLVRRYRGDVTVESQIGQTTLCVRFPFEQPLGS